MSSKIVTLLSLTLAVAPPLTAQDFEIGGSVRGGVALHAGGFERRVFPPASTWQHRVTPSVVLGASLGAQIAEVLGVRVDADLVPRANLEPGEGGPRLGGQGDPAAWIVASIQLTPSITCGEVCARLAVGYGYGHFEFSQDELRGHVVNPVARAQWTGVWRLALDLSARRLARYLSLTVADHIAQVDPYYSGEHLTPLHLG